MKFSKASSLCTTRSIPSANAALQRQNHLTSRLRNTKNPWSLARSLPFCHLRLTWAEMAAEKSDFLGAPKPPAKVAPGTNRFHHLFGTGHKMRRTAGQI